MDWTDVPTACHGTGAGPPADVAVDVGSAWSPCVEVDVEQTGQRGPGRRRQRERPRQLPRAVRPPQRHVGEDPDPRFTMANERTFLAWIRTALGLDAAGLAVITLLPALPVPYAREVFGIALVALGTLVAAISFRRWASLEDALREGHPLPPSRLPGLLAGTLAVVSLAAAVLLTIELL